VRRAAKIDDNQPDIVKALRKIPGVTVEVGHDDILVGYKGRTYWFEVKHPDAISKRTGTVKNSEITKSERGRLDNFTGHYSVIWDVCHILKELGI
jgi:hypothetical protein